MENLPRELTDYIRTFCPPEWFRLCTHQHFLSWLDKFPTNHMLIQWMYYRVWEENARQKLYRSRLELQTMRDSSPFYRDFRDVDRLQIRQLELESDVAHYGECVRLYNRKSRQFGNRLSKFYALSRLERLFQRSRLFKPDYSF